MRVVVDLKKIAILHPDSGFQGPMQDGLPDAWNAKL